MDEINSAFSLRLGVFARDVPRFFANNIAKELRPDEYHPAVWQYTFRRFGQGRAMALRHCRCIV